MAPNGSLAQPDTGEHGFAEARRRRILQGLPVKSGYRSKTIPDRDPGKDLLQLPSQCQLCWRSLAAETLSAELLCRSLALRRRAPDRKTPVR